MSFADDAASFAGIPGGVCSVGLLLDDITTDDPDLADEVRAALTNRRLSSTGIMRALRSRGWEITINPIERHRRGECKCPSPTK